MGGAILGAFLGWLGVGVILLLQVAPNASVSDEPEYRFWWVVALHRTLSSWRAALVTFGLVFVVSWAAGLNLLFALEMAVAATVVLHVLLMRTLQGFADNVKRRWRTSASGSSVGRSSAVRTSSGIDLPADRDTID